MKLLTAVLFICVTKSSISAPLISAPWGQIQGIDKQGQNGGLYSAYQGIPYALPPVGIRRYSSFYFFFKTNKAKKK